MDINTLLQGVACACGKHHTCNIQSVYIEKDAIKRLETICREFHSVLVVADENTFAAAGDKTLAALQDKKVKQVIFGKETLVPNETAIDTVTANLDGVDLIVGIGSGVMQDLCKYVSFYNHIPYLVVATAPSMDGYASDGAAMITGGMKVTYPAGLPISIVADTTVLANAPLEMLKAGFGDVVGKFSALNDWKLSHLVHGEYFCQYIYDLTYQQMENVLKLADGILKRDEAAIKALMEALVVIGILMSFAGSSRPASGSEHHFSHFFEITGILENTPYFSHGIDVAYSTVITAKLREELVKTPFPKTIYRPVKEEYEATMRRVYQSSADGCMQLQEKIGRYKDVTPETYLPLEKEIKEILAEMPTAKEIEDMLKTVGLDMQEFFDLYGEQKIKDAVLYAKELKDRYTVLWLYYDLLGEQYNG